MKVEVHAAVLHPPEPSATLPDGHVHCVPLGQGSQAALYLPGLMHCRPAPHVVLSRQTGLTQEPEPFDRYPDGHVHCTLAEQETQAAVVVPGRRHCFPAPQPLSVRHAGVIQLPYPVATCPEGHEQAVLMVQFVQLPPEHCFPAPQEDAVHAQAYVVMFPVRVQVGTVEAHLFGLQASIHPPAPFATAGEEHLQSVAPASQAVHWPRVQRLPAAHVMIVQGSMHLLFLQM